MVTRTRRRPPAVLTVVALTALSLLMFGSEAHAQTPPPPTLASVASPGRDVVASLMNGRELNGRLRSVSPNAIEFIVDDKTVTVPIADIWRLEERFRDPIRDGVKHGAIIGLVVGGIFGTLIGLSSCGDSGFIDFCSSGGFLIVAGGMGLYGTGIGAVSGAIGDSLNRNRREVWVRSVTSNAITVAPFGTRDGGGVRVNVRW